MEVRYYRNPEKGLPHIHDHGVTEAEAEWVLVHPGEDDACSGVRPDEVGDGVFVVTAYPLTARQLKAFRRRKRRRGR
jgi:hypothetical protein